MYRNYLKRAIDITISLLILPIFVIIYIFVAIMIKLDDRGPILYCGERVGKDLKKFKMYKFRSMIVNAPDIRNEDGSTYNERNDSRQTRVGKFLRKTSIDEIPQILNVLKGNMSIIGPRPSPLGNKHLYSEEYLNKFSIRPGITGYTQAYYRNSVSMKNRQKSDLYYVNNISFNLDMKILFKTIVTVLKRKGLYTNDEAKKDEKSKSMRKILFVSNISKRITNFAIPSIVAGQNLGYEVHLAANYSEFSDDASKYNVTIHHIDLVRNPLSLKNIKAYKQMLNLIKQKKFDVIHCNTPIGGVLGRLCGKKAKVPIIIYTAHGFHFYKGSPFINRTLFKWVEMWMAHYTDAIITINQEDYLAAQKFKLRKGGNVYYIPGVGVDTSTIKQANSKREEILREIGADNDSVLIVSVGELNKNKNNVVIIKALGKLRNPKLHHLLCGIGDKRDELISIAKENNINKNIHFMGYRTDVPQLLKSCNIFVMPSYREGLSRAIIEAMSAGLPCIGFEIRGNVDLIENGKGGYLVKLNNIDKLAEIISKLAENKELRQKMCMHNLEAVKKYDIKYIKNIVSNIYFREVFKDDNDK